MAVDVQPCPATVARDPTSSKYRKKSFWGRARSDGSIARRAADRAWAGPEHRTATRQPTAALRLRCLVVGLSRTEGLRSANY